MRKDTQKSVLLSFIAWMTSVSVGCGLERTDSPSISPGHTRILVQIGSYSISDTDVRNPLLASDTWSASRLRELSKWYLLNAYREHHRIVVPEETIEDFMISTIMVPLSETFRLVANGLLRTSREGADSSAVYEGFLKGKVSRKVWDLAWQEAQDEGLDTTVARYLQDATQHEGDEAPAASLDESGMAELRREVEPWAVEDYIENMIAERHAIPRDDLRAIYAAAADDLRRAGKLQFFDEEVERVFWEFFSVERPEK